MRAVSCPALAALALSTLGACAPELPACDREAARAPLYYDDNGYPAYPGQALVDVSCGGGAFCHAQGIADEDRLGAPEGLDLDVAVGPDGAVSVLDEDEFAEHRVRYAYPDELIIGAQAATEFVLGAIDAGHGPFNGVADEWFSLI